MVGQTSIGGSNSHETDGTLFTEPLNAGLFDFLASLLKEFREMAGNRQYPAENQVGRLPGLACLIVVLVG